MQVNPYSLFVASVPGSSWVSINFVGSSSAECYRKSGISLWLFFPSLFLSFATCNFHLHSFAGQRSRMEVDITF